jgi:RNA polymerase sigma-70 factor (ECF subfamily)
MVDIESFQSYRPLLFAVAYRMLGSAGEAEDVLQDAYLRYAAAEPGEIRSLKSYLTTIVSRLCLDRLKSAQASREQYIGTWLPEPLLTADGDELLRSVEQRESLSLAFLVLLEALTPPERAVFLLREVFEYDYDEIAGMLGLGAANCRQLFHRAQARLAARRPRFRPSLEHQRELLARFIDASQRGDLSGLTALLAEDAVVRSDGGGRVRAARRPVFGRDAAARMLIGLTQKTLLEPGDLRATVELVNGSPVLLLWRGATLDTLVGLAHDGGQIVEILLIRNPEKLSYIAGQIPG